MRFYYVVIMIFLVVFIVGCSNTNNISNIDKNNNIWGNNTFDVVKVGVPVVGKDLSEILVMMTPHSVDYEITSKGNVSEATMIYALPKFAMISDLPDQGKIEMIFDGESMITCTNTDDVWSCYILTAETPETVKITEDIKSGVLKITIIGTCNVASESGSKYEIESDGVKSIVCYTHDGILLEMKNNESEMIATKVSRGVSDDVFVPPSQPKDFRALTNKYD